MRNMLTEIIAEVLSPNREQNAIPPMDGAWTPNSLLEEAPRLSEGYQDPHDFCVGPNNVLFVADGVNVLRLFGKDWRSREVVATVEATVLGLAWHDQAGLLACIDGVGVRVIQGPMTGAAFLEANGATLLAPRAALVTGSDKLLVADGSRGIHGSDWVLDFMAKGRSGRVVAFDLATGKGREICTGLGYPSSLMLSQDGGTVFFPEAWRAQISSLPLAPGEGQQDKQTVVRNLPAYPWRLARGRQSLLVSFLSMRTQLMEFLLGEDAFRSDMMRQVPRDFWVAPAFRSRAHVYEPIQGGQLLQHGKAKAWAPSRSYGLLAELRPNFEVSRTFHARHGEEAHGIVAALEADGRRLALSAGAEALLDLGAL